MKTIITTVFAILATVVFGASSQTATAPAGTDNFSIGYGAGYQSGGSNSCVICIGTDAGMNSSNNHNCVFIGKNAGKGVVGKTGYIDIGGKIKYTKGFSEGYNTTASGNYSHAEGYNTTASGNYSHAEGLNCFSTHNRSYVWNGEYNDSYNYYSNGDGTYNVNPTNGLYGFWIGSKNLYNHIIDTVSSVDFHFLKKIKDNYNNYSGIVTGSLPSLSRASEWSSRNWYSAPSIVKRDNQLYVCTSIDLIQGGTWGSQSNYWEKVEIGSNSVVVGDECVAHGYHSISGGDESYSYGNYSVSFGRQSFATGMFSCADGIGCIANGENSKAYGYLSCSTNDFSFVWQGHKKYQVQPYSYYDNGQGTFNVNPYGGITGFFIGKTNIVNHVKNIIGATFAFENGQFCVYTNGVKAGTLTFTPVP